jgi:hypothetical protein
MFAKFAAVTPMNTLIVAIIMHPMTTGPTGSWNGTADLFEICRPRQMNVHVAYAQRHTDAESIINAMVRPKDVYEPSSPDEREWPGEDVNA